MPGRVALVTGGARGIGLATALRLLNDGFRVGVVDVSDRALDELSGLCAEHAGRLHAERASVASRVETEQAAAALVQRWGSLDVLVNNAALNRPGGLFDQADADWDAVLEVNLKGAFLASRAAASFMREQRYGAIINVGSIGAEGMGASPAYAASKAGLAGLTKQMARELGPYGITVNLVAPGVTLTGWVERNLGPERIRAAAEEAPLRRVGTPEDIAGVIAFLASDDARHITGQVISVSGGAWMP